MQGLVGQTYYSYFNVKANVIKIEEKKEILYTINISVRTSDL